jgi:hypothetical protein
MFFSTIEFISLFKLLSEQVSNVEMLFCKPCWHLVLIHFSYIHVFFRASWTSCLPPRYTFQRSLENIHTIGCTTRFCCWSLCHKFEFSKARILPVWVYHLKRYFASLGWDLQTNHWTVNCLSYFSFPTILYPMYILRDFLHTITKYAGLFLFISLWSSTFFLYLCRN